MRPVRRGHLTTFQLKTYFSHSLGLFTARVRVMSQVQSTFRSSLYTFILPRTAQFFFFVPELYHTRAAHARVASDTSALEKCLWTLMDGITEREAA